MNPIFKISNHLQELEKIKTNLTQNELNNILGLKNKDSQKQRANAYYLIKQTLNNNQVEIKYLENGRPYLDNQNLDISISHKEDIVFIGIVDNKYRVGVDVEKIEQKINTSNFQKHILNENEIETLNKFSKNNNISKRTAMITFWSIKEAFFKAIEQKINLKDITINHISKEGKIDFLFSNQLKQKMQNRKIILANTTTNKTNIYSKIILE